MHKSDSVIPEGMLWNEAEIDPGHELHNIFVMLAVIKIDLTPELIGTGFLVTADGNSATAISAAHCFEGIRSILNPHLSHHPSTPSEFLPEPTELELKQVKAFYTKNGKVFVCPVRIAIWDSATDLATLTIDAPENENDLFKEFLWITDKIPEVGAEVAMFGYGGMEVDPTEAVGKGIIRRRLIMRVGTIQEIHPEGFYRLKAPCVETTIQIYGGMSGGVVARWSRGSRIEPFAFISHSMTLGDNHFNDRAVSGHSTGSFLKAKITYLADMKQQIEIEVNNIGVGRNNLS